MTAADYIPFVNTVSDSQIAARFYSDAVAIRVNLECLAETRPYLPTGPKRWVDASIDGLHRGDPSKLSQRYREHLSKFTGYERIADPAFQTKPDKAVAQKFVNAVLDCCKAEGPDWLTVPQLPFVAGSARNKINRLLAELTGLWKSKSGYTGQFVLPAIFTHQNQINKKIERNMKIGAISVCYSAAGANSLWVVDSTLDDQEGSGKFDVRFPALRKFHEELNDAMPSNVTIAGPYWGMNLVLWARGCIRFPAIGVGWPSRYYVPGQPLHSGIVRIALRPLRRCAIASPSLKTWLAETVASLPVGDPARAEFAAIEKDFPKLRVQPNGKEQIAKFYKSWLDRFAVLPQPGRALALYQDLSSAYVLGRNLKQLPEKKEGTARRPERIAQQLMLNCL